jgi:hypothetical protein
MDGTSSFALRRENTRARARFNGVQVERRAIPPAQAHCFDAYPLADSVPIDWEEQRLRSRLCAHWHGITRAILTDVSRVPAAG